VAARLKAAGAHVTAIGRHAMEHLAADEFVPADITTVGGTDKVIEQTADNGGADIIVHAAGGTYDHTALIIALSSTKRARGDARSQAAPARPTERGPMSWGPHPFDVVRVMNFDAVRWS